MSASTANVVAHLRWVESPCSQEGAVDLELYVDGRYAGVVCTATSREGEWDGWMVAVAGEHAEHFRTREECVAYLEMAAHGGERGRA